MASPGGILRWDLARLFRGRGGLPTRMCLFRQEALVSGRSGVSDNWYGGAGEVRTPDLEFRKLLLYPSELQPRNIWQQFPLG
jgi:hypothetical protein